MVAGVANHEQWTAVDDYINGLFVPSDQALDAALKDSTDAGLPAISVAPNQGKMLYVLAKACRARRILEIGTLGAYSTIWLARALPEGGRLISLEYNPKHAQVANANLKRAGVSHLVDVRLGPAQETLPQLADEGMEPFDFIFIDADKSGYPIYFEAALKLGTSGTLIIADNVVRGGKVIDAASEDESVQGVRRYHELVAAEPRVSATTIQTVGSKGYDGFCMAVIN